MKNKIKWDFEDIFQRIEDGETQKDIAFDLNVAPETLNRKLSGYKQAIKNSKKAMSEKELDRIARARNKLVIERKIINIQKQSFNKNSTAAARMNVLINKVKEEIPKIKLNKYKHKVLKNNLNNKTIFYLISDTHYVDEILTPKKDYINTILKIITKDISINNPKEIKLIHLGDFIEGRIHRSQDFETKTTVIKQTRKAAEIIGSIVKELSNFFSGKITLGLVANGNHDELGLFSPRDIRENITYIIYDILKGIFSLDKNIEIICDPYIYIKEQNKTLLFTHLFTRNSNPKNVGQFTNIINDFRYKKHFDYSFTGHNHLSYSLDFKSKSYKHFGVPATKLYDNEWEKINNMFSTKGMCKLVLESDNSIDWKVWYF